MKKIAFHSGQLGLRGTEVALYDYARYNEEILGNKSIITVQDPNIRKGWSDPSAIKKFKDRFPVFYYKDFSEVDKILDDNNIDIFYMQKAGDRSILPKEIKTVIHSVFQYNEPHGNVYAYISKWLGDLYNKPYVPYICDLPNHNDDLRELLKIPKDATVFGRHGGIETFDIGYAQESVIEISNERDDIYFIFLNTQRFTNNKNVIFLNGTSDMYQKVRFINTCDAMLHARQRGESFGLAIAEFSLRNKPIICWKGGTDLAHVDMLGDTAFYYENKTELKSILSDFKIDNSVNYDIYKKYNPKDVMQKFKEVFIDK